MDLKEKGIYDDATIIFTADHGKFNEGVVFPVFAVKLPHQDGALKIDGFCEDQYLILDSDRILTAKVFGKLYNAVESMRNIWNNTIISVSFLAKLPIFLEILNISGTF